MAKNEITIPVIVQLNESPSLQPNKPKVEDTTETTIKTEKQPTEDNKATLGDALSVGFLLSSSQKLISATGNSGLAKITGETIKWGTMISQAIFNPNPYIAIATMAIELSALAIQKVNELKQEAQENNAAKYNQIKSGQVYLGNDYYITKDIWGNKNYNKR